MSQHVPQWLSRRSFIFTTAGIAFASVASLNASNALAQSRPKTSSCNGNDSVGNSCADTLVEEFTSTSFSTTSVSSGTNYSILFSTHIPRASSTPGEATGYKIESLSISGVDKDGVQFTVTPAIGEKGPRLFGARSASSLGFILDHPWRASELIRTLAYSYNVVYLRGLTPIQTCNYVTAMRLADNGMVLGGVGSVVFSPPQLSNCER